jgi:hypothetical protein
LAVCHAIGDPDVGFKHALADRMFILGELLDRAIVDDENRHGQVCAEGREPHPA